MKRIIFSLLAAGMIFGVTANAQIKYQELSL